jgi:hypothetical protein
MQARIISPKVGDFKAESFGTWVGDLLAHRNRARASKILKLNPCGFATLRLGVNARLRGIVPSRRESLATQQTHYQAFDGFRLDGVFHNDCADFGVSATTIGVSF